MSRDFAENLHVLCSYYPSITEVCRRLRINRPQFMKYLSGASFPSRHTMRRICDFFGVEDFEILMPHAEFGEIVKLRKPKHSPMPPLAEEMVDAIAAQRGDLARYAGYYFRSFYSFSAPGLILRSLVHVYPFEDYMLYKTVECLRRPNIPLRNAFLFKYSGSLFMVGSRLHMLDCETIQRREVSHSILYPPSTNRLSVLIGLIMGISGTEQFQPVATRVAMEYLGPNINRRAALERCGLFSDKSGEIDPTIINYIGSPMTGKSHLLRAE